MKKIVLITGASSGMGKVTAQLLAQNGYTVYGAARRMDKMNDLIQYGVKTLQMDVTNDEDIVKGINTIISSEGRIDVLVNNAGFGSYGAVEDVPIADAKYQLDVNVFGAARLAQLVIPHMREQRYGKIINISSIGGKVAMPLGGWYHASKFALEALSDSMRAEVKPFGIDVIVIEPGGVKSEWADIAFDNGVKKSGNGAYKAIANKFASMNKELGDKAAEPMVIAKIIQEAITAKNPKTRYSGGYMAGPILFLRKILSDKMMDKIIASQIK